MAEGEDRKDEFELLPSMTVPNDKVTKQQAIDRLQQIISSNKGREPEIDKNAKKLLKCLQENEKPDELLSPSELQEFSNIIEAVQLHNLRAMEIGVGLELGLRRRNIVVNQETSPVAAMEDKLKTTREQLQDALDKIHVLNNDLTQVRSQLSNERITFQNEMASMREERNRERLVLEQEIRALRTTISALENDKQDLERQIRKLRTEMEEEKATNEKFKQDQIELVKKLSETNMNEIARLETNVNQLMEENKKLKTREPYKLVGYCVTLITNALFKFVHQAELRKKYYSIDDLESHITSRYRGNVEGRRSAEGRWEDIKEKIGWNDGTPALLHQLAENRERGPNSLNICVSYSEFSEAVRVMFGDKELDQSEMESIRDLFVKCNDNLPMQPQN